LYLQQTGKEGHPSCHENFLKAAAELGLEFDDALGPVNLFQNTPVAEDQSLLIESSPTKAGDYVEFEAQMDLYLILTACSYDLDPVFIGGKSTPLLIEIFE
jgi:uncharacterized protein YcgI (DUF1989 family)